LLVDECLDIHAAFGGGHLAPPCESVEARLSGNERRASARSGWGFFIAVSP
jgi:hypothetical protein